MGTTAAAATPPPPKANRRRRSSYSSYDFGSFRFLLCSATATVAAASSSSCGVYLADSSILPDGAAGLGMFAGKLYEANSQVLSGDLLVPIHDRSWHTGDIEEELLWDEYVWNARE